MWTTEEVNESTFNMVISMRDWRTMQHNTSTIYVEMHTGRWLGEKKQDGSFHLSEDIAPLKE